MAILPLVIKGEMGYLRRWQQRADSIFFILEGEVV
jgi:uncharacterized cupin superfamily protein